jgi:metal-responsive CopG/Arc/MetJ family transcriptional regulator
MPPRSRGEFERITFEIPPSLAAELRTACKRQERTVSATVRWLIRRYLEEVSRQQRPA